MNKIILKQDSRDVHVLDHFGAPSSIPLEIEFDKGLTNPIEAAGAVDCTAIAGSDVATDQTGIIYDTNDLWSLTPKTSNGADPRDSMSIITNKGLLPLGGQIRDQRWASYMRADGNSGDYFANSQASMTSLNSSSTNASNWYLEWDYVGPDGVLPEGKTWVSGHDYKITGWRQGITEMEFHVKHWLGYMVWMPKSVYNEEMNKYGTCAFIPTTQIALTIGEKTLMQWLSDLIVNIGLSFQQKVLNVLPTSGFPPILYTVAKNNIGKHLTLDPNTPPELGCAECQSKIFLEANVKNLPTQGFENTIQIDQFMSTNPQFQKITTPEIGAIIVAVTQGNNHGHIGTIAMYALQYTNDWGILSNDSNTGTLREGWSYSAFVQWYSKNLGLSINMYRLVS